MSDHMSPSQNATMLYPTPYGALTQLFAGTMPEAINYNGEVCAHSCSFSRASTYGHVFLQYLIPWARLGRCRPEAYDDELGERLWKWLEDEVKSHMG